jgi:hypothetical protein
MRRVFFLLVLCLTSVVRAWALPSYALRYNVPCATCHTVAPALNSFGQAFQANYFRWPTGQEPEKATGLKALPVSVIATGSQDSGQKFSTTTKLRALQLNLSAAGYFIAAAPAATPEARQGSLKGAYIAVPTGRKGLAVVAGQSSPLMYQYDPVNALTAALPGALTGSVRGFSPVDCMPTVRADYFSGRGGATPDGTYLSVGVPFGGALGLQKGARVRESNGLYAHAFQRQGATSAGLFGYARGSASLVSALGTYQVNPRSRLLLIGTTGTAPGERVRSASLEAEHVAQPGLAVTGRLEWGDFAPYPVVALNYSPPSLGAVRLSLETAAQHGQRRLSLATRIQL